MYIQLFKRVIFGKTRYFTNCLCNQCLAEITIDADLLMSKDSDNVLYCYKCGQRYAILKVRNKKGGSCQIDIEMFEAPEEPSKDD